MHLYQMLSLKRKQQYILKVDILSGHFSEIEAFSREIFNIFRLLAYVCGEDNKNPLPIQNSWKCAMDF